MYVYDNLFQHCLKGMKSKGKQIFIYVSKLAIFKSKE